MNDQDDQRIEDLERRIATLEDGLHHLVNLLSWSLLLNNHTLDQIRKKLGTCQECDGNGWLFNGGHSSTCPHCNGKGYLHHEITPQTQQAEQENKENTGQAITPTTPTHEAERHHQERQKREWEPMSNEEAERWTRAGLGDVLNGIIYLPSRETQDE